MKKFISGLIIGVMLSLMLGVLAASYVAEPATFKVLVNGKEFVSDPPALVVEGRTYLPLRAMGDALGVPVIWNTELGQAEVGNSAPVAAVNQYSRANPAPINTVQTYTKTSRYIERNNYTVAVRVMETVRGEKAFKALKDRSSLYPKPNDGYEYINVKIAFSVLDAESDISVEPSLYDFQVFSSNNEESPMNYYSSIEPPLSGALYEGGNTEGWITVMVKKDDANPKLVYDLEYDGAGGIWFALQ